jgi:hypothetical protein
MHPVLNGPMTVSIRPLFVSAADWCRRRDASRAMFSVKRIDVFGSRRHSDAPAGDVELVWPPRWSHSGIRSGVGPKVGAPIGEKQPANRKISLAPVFHDTF